MGPEPSKVQSLEKSWKLINFKILNSGEANVNIEHRTKEINLSAFCNSS